LGNIQILARSAYEGWEKTVKISIHQNGRKKTIAEEEKSQPETASRIRRQNPWHLGG
jgi:hypothetical protein